MKVQAWRAYLGALLLVVAVPAVTHAAEKAPKPAKSNSSVAATAATADPADPSALRIGVDGHYPPFSSVDKAGKLSGFDIDIARALCEQMKVKCRLMPMSDWAQVIPSIQAGKYDAVVASMSISDERLEKIDFTQSYYHVPAKLVARKGVMLVNFPAELAGKRIGVQEGTAHEAFADASLASVCQVSKYSTLPEALEDLQKSKLDFVLGDSLALTTGFLEGKQGKNYALVGPDFSDSRWFGDGIGIALPKHHDQLREQLNQAILALRADGTYQKISAKYFVFDVYGGAQ